MKHTFSIIDLIFPEKCPFCGRITAAQELYSAGSCKNCREELITYKTADELPHEALEKVLKLYVPMRYSGNAKKAMLRYKFGQEEWLSESFSRIMHNYLTSNGAYEDIDLITCVPVSPKRFAGRGYDQSRLIARKLSEYSGRPFRDLLKRNDNSKKAAFTSRENFAERASEKRFEAADPELSLFGSRVLLVDDIFTTGSTLNECAGILLGRGAMYVNAACMMSGRQDIYDAPLEETA